MPTYLNCKIISFSFVCGNIWLSFAFLVGDHVVLWTELIIHEQRLAVFKMQWLRERARRTHWMDIARNTKQEPPKLSVEMTARVFALKRVTFSWAKLKHERKERHRTLDILGDRPAAYRQTKGSNYHIEEHAHKQTTGLRDQINLYFDHSSVERHRVLNVSRIQWMVERVVHDLYPLYLRRRKMLLPLSLLPVSFDWTRYTTESEYVTGKLHTCSSPVLQWSKTLTFPEATSAQPRSKAKSAQTERA